MVIIEVEDSVSHAELTQASVEDMENVINKKIRDALSTKIIEALDDMAYVDMEEVENGFSIKASLILCATQDIASSLEMVAQKLKQYELDEEEIEEVLSAFTETNGGF